MKSALALLATLACLRAMASPTCPVDGFYPSSGAGASDIDHAVADPKPEFSREDEESWFDLIEVWGLHERGWKPIYEVSLLRSDKGDFRVVLGRAKNGAHESGPGRGVVDSRDLPAAIAQRLHRAVIPVLGRTHYAAELLEKDPPLHVQCTDGTTLYVTVSRTDNRYNELVGEARPYGKDTEAGAVQVLGHALYDYALRRIDEQGLDAPLKLVEAHARPANQPAP